MKKINTKIKKELKRLGVELEAHMLNSEQIRAVKTMIVKSMENVYTDRGQKPTTDFYEASGRIADGIIKDTQKALLQSASFERAVENSKPLKAKKNK